MHQHPIILFDGVCNLCNKAIQFVIKQDPKEIFVFASLQSDIGQQILKQYNLPLQQLSSFVLLQNDKIYTKSTAAIKVAQQLNGLWKCFYIFNLVPAFIRDGVYNFIAKNRYKWFGKQDNCMIPSPQLKQRFLS